MGLFGKKKKNDIIWNNDGWTVVQESDPDKHILTINVRAENGTIVEVRTRHTRGEEVKGTVTLDGKDVLPISIEEFKKLFEAGKLEIK